MYLVKTDFIDEDIIVIDCRYEMTNPPYGYDEYKKGHLKNAFYIDLDKDMTSHVGLHGGRHPLADLKTFALKISKMGIKENSNVLVYDNGELAMATRLWFMLNLIGIKNVYVLEGGFEALKNAGLEMSQKEAELIEHEDYFLNLQTDLICDMDYVKKSMSNEQACLIDSRSKERYLGLVEPFDKHAGRIPTSLNYFWKDNFDGVKVKNYGQIEAMFLELNNYSEVIVHCGSGITGCVNMFLLGEIGIKSKLYLGSYSDWISYSENEIIVKEHKSIKIKALES